MREYVPPKLRKQYLDQMVTIDVASRLYFRFCNISKIEEATLLVYEGREWSCLYEESLEGYNFLAYKEEGCRFLCGKAVLFTDGEVGICAQEKWYDSANFTDDEKIQYLRSQYYESINPSNALYLPTYDVIEPFNLSVLFPMYIKQGKVCFIPLGQRKYYVLRFGEVVYIFNLHLIRKQSVLKIWNQWKLYKNRKQVLLQP